jgi:hypothetical protein
MTSENPATFQCGGVFLWKAIPKIVERMKKWYEQIIS